MPEPVYHKIRDKPWDEGDWVIATIIGTWLIVFFGSAFVHVMGWDRSTVNPNVVWMVVIPKDPWLLTLLLIPIISGVVGVARNPNICDRHGCKMLSYATAIDEVMSYYCKRCSREETRDREHAEREVRIEEMAEGYRRAHNAKCEKIDSGRWWEEPPKC